MAETLQFTSTVPTADAGTKTSTLSLWVIPPVESRLLGIKFFGDNKGTYEVLDQGGPVTPYVAEVLVSGTTQTAKRDEIAAWYALLWTKGSVTIIQEDYSPSAFDNMTLTNVEPPPNIEPGTLRIGLEFVRSQD